MHKLTNIDIPTRTAICELCGPVKIQRAGVRQGWRCIVKARELRSTQGNYGDHKARRRTFEGERHQYRKAKLGKSLEELACIKCRFIPQHKVQIDVHHKDRDRSNNSPENLEFLCANCHRLEHAVV